MSELGIGENECKHDFPELLSTFKTKSSSGKDNASSTKLTAHKQIQ